MKIAGGFVSAGVLFSNRRSIRLGRCKYSSSLNLKFRTRSLSHLIFDDDGDDGRARLLGNGCVATKRTAQTHLFTRKPDADVGVTKRTPLLVQKILATSWIRAIAIFAIGYGIGNASAPGWQRHSQMTRKIGLTRIALVFFVSRDLWRSTPQWIKPRITRYGKKVVNLIRSPCRSEASGKDDAETEDLDDLTDMSNFATKLSNSISVVDRKLDLDGKDDDDFNIQASFVALLQILLQVKSRGASVRDEIYRSSGIEVPDDMLESMDEMFELADLAYNEHKDGDMKEVLCKMGYKLIKHDNTQVPGYLGHYVAISSDQSAGKTAIIGVKGTSSLEDLLTDCCASSVNYKLTPPFHKGGNNSLRCHEGVFISSQRLAEDVLPLVKNLLLPSGYKIVISGHSLGAAAACLLALFLRGSITSLQENDSDKMKVWSFAPPPTLDFNSAVACSSFVTSVVNNCDIVPRANISPLANTVGLMRVVNERLKRQGLSTSDFKSTVTFLKKIREGADGEMLMSADEVFSELDKILDCDDLIDPDHLYVPGKVVLLFDPWGEGGVGTVGKSNETFSLASFVKNLREQLNDNNMRLNNDDVKQNEAKEAVLCPDGSCKALRFIELDGRMLDDHMAPPYRASIANILSLRYLHRKKKVDNNSGNE